MEKYIIKFDETGKRVNTYLSNEYAADDLAKMLGNGYVYVNEDDFQIYIGNKGMGDNGTGYIRGKDGIPTSAPAYVASREEKANAISQTYKAQISDLKDALVTATLAGNNVLIESLKSDYADAMKEYQTALKGVE